MSHAKQMIIKNLSDISDDIQDEFEILENLYKLLKLEKSRHSVQEEGSYSTDEARQYFQERHWDSSPESYTPFSNNEKSGVLI